MINNTKYCQKCAIPESKFISLDEKGICNFCNTNHLNEQITARPNLDKLDSIIKQIKSNNEDNEFDCIVGWSGGRDSTYLLHELVTKHHLRCVAIFGKTPFTPTEIIENVRKISKQLKIKLIEFDTPDHHKEIATYCVKQFIKHKSPIMVNLACSSCKFVNKEIFIYAKKLKIDTIIYGGNRFEYFPSGPASIDIDKGNRYSFINMLKDNFLRIGKGLKILLQSPSLFKYLGIFIKASILYVNQYSIYFRLKYPNIKRFDYFHYAEWDEETVNSILKKLNWQLPKGCNSTWRADCAFEAIKNTAFEKSVGYTYTHAFYSNLIRAGKISRDKAIQKVEDQRISREKLEEALNICGLPIDSFD